MIKKLVQYPDERIKITSADVRSFDDELLTLIENMKDTIEANELSELAAIQIAVPATVVIIKEGDDYLELINPRIIRTTGMQESAESTNYLPNISATLDRYDEIKVIYQDREGKQRSMDVAGELSKRIQRKIDYTFGGTFVDKLPKKEQKRVEKELEYGIVEGSGGTCPTISYRQHFLNAIKLLLAVMFLTFLASLFVAETSTLSLLYSAELWMTGINVLLLIGYTLYAQYETSKFSSCTSCQTANTYGNVAFLGLALLIVWLLSYFIVNPS
jgi:peptide deformylase